MSGRLVLRKTIAAAPAEVFSFWTDAAFASHGSGWASILDLLAARAEGKA